MDFGYLKEKFSVARYALMLPHSRGEEESISGAFSEIKMALDLIDRNELDQSANDNLDKIIELMDFSGLVDKDKEGLFLLRARTLTTDEKIDLSHAVDELANWFQRKYFIINKDFF